MVVREVTMNKEVEGFLKENPEWLVVIEEAMKVGVPYKVELFLNDKGNIKDRQYKFKRLIIKNN